MVRSRQRKALIRAYGKTMAQSLRRDEMNYVQFIAWVNDPTRTRTEIKTAYTALGLTGLAPAAPTMAYKGAVLTHAVAQPGTDPIPPALATAIGVPAPAAAPAPTPTPAAATPAAATPQPVQHRQMTITGIAATLAAGALLVAAILFGIAALEGKFDGNGSDNSDVIAKAIAIANANGSSDDDDPNSSDSTDTGGGTSAPTTAASGTGTMPDLTTDVSHGKWSIKGTDRLADNPIVKDWLSRLCDPAPAEWKVYPNLENPDAKSCPFQVANGMEYGVANVPFCQQDQRCDFVVPAWHYRLITADYDFLGSTCKGDGKKGCALLLINVMDQSYTWRDQIADNGFSVPGRYWNGDKLDEGVWGLVSNTSANMLGMPTLAHPGEVLNAGGDNAGSNCGTPSACGSVDFTVVVHAGDAIIAVAHTVVTP